MKSFSSARGYDPVPPSRKGWDWLTTLLPYLFEFRWRVVVALLCLVGAKLASVGMPFLLKHQVDTLNQLPSGGVPQEQWWLWFPLGLLLAYGLARLMSVLFGELRDLVFGRVSERAMRRMALRVFRHLHQLSLAFHLDRQTGALQRDIERGLQGISFLLRFIVFNILPTLLELLMVTGLLLFNYPPVFALITAVAVVVYVGYSFRMTEWRTQYVREANRMDSTTHARALDSLLNYETVKYFNAESREAQHYDESLAEWEQARQKNRYTLFGLNAGQALIISTAMMSMLMFAAWYVVQGTMTIGDFTLINAFMFQLFLPLNFLGFVYRELKASMANIERMFELLDEESAVKDNGTAVLDLKGGEVTFRQVSFGYRDDHQVLDQLDLTIPAGKTLAIVGGSGAGKSTLTRLLFRFYDPSAGVILIDGQPIDQLPQSVLRATLGMVPQDTVLFNDTLKNNLLYARPDATDEELQQVLTMAHLDSLVQRHNDGWHIVVGERGLKLSGGEKQRIAIARMLLKRPAIMLFDEATSSLDSHTERGIMDAIRQVSKGHTTLIIAHRLSTVVDADEIAVMEGGRVVERGSHTQLLSQSGRYAALWQAQQHQPLNPDSHFDSHTDLEADTRAVGITKHKRTDK
ncbi:ABC transporter ATP-binding protein/permease [Oceanobacter sp. 3_MG-2023]|uniref:ABCB family ABC transporter ATP-binding protein/permease n=1 Tax=Oceanobacter sp. 3_MG-2023 TaxID=3062622 RepID=UPI0027353A7C|nr:ABC transporter ATP-binding protein/permease [Oceanobacter sp. 3_MG-2023]MDP2507144.1 ABC transporter ATP-binding protein/permease [Oceanobacter sp. 3_MG-2023]